MGKQRLFFWRKILLDPDQFTSLGSVLALLLLLTVWWHLGVWFKDYLVFEKRTQIRNDLYLVGNSLSVAVNRRLSLLDGLVVFVQTSATTGQLDEDFESFAAGLFASTVGIRNIHLAPLGVVSYVYPQEENQQMFGYNLLEDARAQVRQDMLEAIERRYTVVTGPLELIQGGQGLIVTKAIFIGEQFWGLASIVLDFEPILTNAGLIEGNIPTLYSISNSSGVHLYGSEEVVGNDPVVYQLLFPNQHWQIAALPESGWFSNVRSNLWIFQGITFSIVLLLTVVAQQILRRTFQIREIEARRRVAETLRTILSVLNSKRPMHELLDYIVFQSALLLEADACVYSRIDTASGFVRTEASVGLPASLASITHYQIGESVLESNLIRQREILLQVTQDFEETHLASLSEVDINLGSWWRAVKATYHTLMVVPIVIESKVFASLGFFYKDKRLITDETLSLAETIANQTALAIQNSQLSEQVRTLAISQERQKLARELHDSVSQALYGIGLGARTAHTIIERQRGNGALATLLKEPLEYIQTLVETGLTEMRALIFDLRPESIENEGLVAGLTKQADALQARFEIDVETELCQEPEVTLQCKQALYRIAQEALHNVVKHARASKVRIVLQRDGKFLSLQIEDNGIGFEVDGDFPGHLGLTSMQERAAQLDGEISVASVLKQGTLITLRVPCPTQSRVGDSSASNWPS